MEIHQFTRTVLNSIDLKNKGFATKDEILNLLKNAGIEKSDIIK